MIWSRDESFCVQCLVADSSTWLGHMWNGLNDIADVGTGGDGILNMWPKNGVKKSHLMTVYGGQLKAVGVQEVIGTEKTLWGWWKCGGGLKIKWRVKKANSKEELEILSPSGTFLISSLTLRANSNPKFKSCDANMALSEIKSHLVIRDYEALSGHCYQHVKETRQVSPKLVLWTAPVTIQKEYNSKAR